jgi:hypothetical protein
LDGDTKTSKRVRSVLARSRLSTSTLNSSSIREEYLVARVEQCSESLEDSLLGPVRDHHLGPVDRHVGMAPDILRDRLAQRAQPGGCRVLVILQVVASSGGGSHDMLGRGEVGLTGAEADDVFALGPQLPGPGADAKGG